MWPYTIANYAISPSDIPICYFIHRTRLVESEAMNESLRRSLSRANARCMNGGPTAPTPSLEAQVNDVVRRAKEEVQILRKKMR